MYKLFTHISNFFTKSSREPKQTKPLNYTIDQGVITFEKEFNESIETWICLIIVNDLRTVIFKKTHWFKVNCLIVQIPRDVICLHNPPSAKIDLPKFLEKLHIEDSPWFYVPKYLEKLECFDCRFSSILLCKNIRVLNSQSCKFGNYCLPKSITHLTLYGSHCQAQCVDKLTKNLYYLEYSLSPENKQLIKLPKHIKHVKLGPFFTCIIQIPKLVRRLDVYWFFNAHTIIPDTLKIFNMESANSSIVDNLPNGLERFSSGTFDIIVRNVPSKLIHEQLVPVYK